MLTLVFIIIAVMITKHHAQTDPGDNVTPMELEFKNLANVKAEPSRFVSANLQVVSMTTQTLRKNQPEYGNFHRNAFFALAFEKFT